MLLVVVFADPMMKDQIVSYIANGYASFDGQFLVNSAPHPSSVLTSICQRGLQWLGCI
jgi:hypothetical protein